MKESTLQCRDREGKAAAAAAAAGGENGTILRCKTGLADRQHAQVFVLQSRQVFAPAKQQNYLFWIQIPSFGAPAIPPNSRAARTASRAQPKPSALFKIQTSAAPPASDFSTVVLWWRFRIFGPNLTCFDSIRLILIWRRSEPIRSFDLVRAVISKRHE